MELKPVSPGRLPGYPSKEEITGETLKASPPQRWSKNMAARIALGALAAASLAGCAPEITEITAGIPAPPSWVTEGTVSSTPAGVCDPSVGGAMPAETPIIEVKPSGDVMPPTFNIAPLFIHGDGRGAFGCVMVSPPAFLSEEEALWVINEVAQEYGLAFETDGSTHFHNVLQPVTNMYDSGETRPPGTYITWTPDFSDKDHGLCIEFVSTKDVREWNYAEPSISAGSYDVAEAAAQLSEALENATPGADKPQVVGVLYDPCASVEPEEEDMSSRPSEQSRALAEQQLKAQARDFFEWLKRQGVI